MNQLDELKAAVERKDDKSISVSSRYAACARVADALTDPAPITREKLEAMRFAESKSFEDTFMLKLPNGGKIHWSKVGGEMVFYADNSYAHPQPQTIGDLMHLLLRLSRERTPGDRGTG